MKNCYAIMKRELKSYFSSPIAYAVVAIFLIISGWFFYNVFAFYTLLSFQVMQNQFLGTELSLTEGVIRPLFGNVSVIMLLMMPLLTMRLFAEEKKLGTFELLFTYPIRDIETLVGKFLACVVVFLVMLLMTTLYPVLLAFYGKPEIGPLLSAYLGLFLVGVSFISLGILISSLTENQIVAAVISFGILLLFWVVGWASSSATPSVANLLTHLSILEHFESFSKGVIETKDLVFYLSFSVFFLFLTLRSLESKRWRG